MSLILLSVCFAVVIWSATMHFSFLEINAEYIISSRLRTKSLWWWLICFYTKVLSVDAQARYVYYS